MMQITPDTSIFAPAPRATVEQCARIILSRPHGEYTDHDIADVIVPAYFASCTAVGVDPVLLIAQLIHETGNLTSWWSQRPRRNPAGIGVTGRSQVEQPAKGAWAFRADTGRWYEGVSFASWKDEAIPAHVGRMLAYSLADSGAAPPQREIIARALSYRTLPVAYRGCAPTLQGLNGRWAVPGTTYANKLAQIASTICGS